MSHPSFDPPLLLSRSWCVEAWFEQFKGVLGPNNSRSRSLFMRSVFGVSHSFASLPCRRVRALTLNCHDRWHITLLAFTANFVSSHLMATQDLLLQDVFRPPRSLCRETHGSGVHGSHLLWAAFVSKPSWDLSPSRLSVGHTLLPFSRFCRHLERHTPPSRASTPLTALTTC